MDEKKKELSQKEKRTLMIVSLAIVLALVFGISYAYFMAQDTSAEQQITTQNIGLILDDGTEDDTVTVEMAKNIKPILRENISTKAAKKNFTITNSGDEKMFVHITLEDMTLPSALKRYDFIYSLYEVIDGVEKNVSNGTFADATDVLTIGEYLVFDAPVTTGESPVYDEKEYNLYIWIEETGLNQNTMMGQEFKATIVATGEVYHTSPESDFTVSEDGVVTGYNGSGGDVIIPESVGGVAVTSITDYLFIMSGKTITSVVIPNGVTSIGNGSISNQSSILKVVLPNTLTSIGSSAFEGASLTTINIPGSVTSIGDSVFTGNQLTNIVIPDSVTSIGSYAFLRTNLSNVIIPSSVTTIGANIFGSDDEYEQTPTLNQIIIQGKSEAPEGFSEGWDTNISNIKFNAY